MKHLKSRLFVVGCALTSLSSYGWATSITFGTTVTGTIGSPGQSNDYTFSANAGDVVDFTMVTTSGNLSPKIQVYNPTGQLLASASPFACNGSTIELNTLSLSVTGTYSAIVSDCSAANTGNYSFYLQRTNNPTGAANLPFGGTKTGSIGSSAQSNSYTFSANASDVMDFTIVTTNGALSPKLRLYSPAGQLVASASPFACNGATQEMNTVTLSATGTYTLLVGDCSDINSGSYVVYDQRTNNPSGAKSLPFDQVQTGTIGSAAQSSTYTFSGTVNGTVDFTIVTTSGTLSPKIRLYSPAGQLVASASAFACNGSTQEMNTVTLPASGTYVVLVGDCADTNTGNYDLYMQLTENPVGAANLPFGQVVSGTISAAAQSYTYTFGANAKDVVDFTLATTSGSLSPKIRVYNSLGVLIGSASAFACNGFTQELNTLTLPTSDIYTVLVGDCSDINSGSYDIYMQRLNNPSGAPMFLLAQTQTGNLASATQSTSYIFSASANDVFDFTVLTTSGSVSPKLRLYNPTGSLVASASAFACNGASQEMNAVTLPASGTYTLLVGDCSDTQTGNYIIYGQRTLHPFGPVPLVIGGQTQPGSIAAQTQSNTFTFSASANSVANFTMVTTSGSLSPKIRVYNPLGALVGSASPFACNGSTIQLNSVALTLAGTYTVLTGDCSDTLTGNYNLSTQCFGTCPAMPAITWATPAAITHGTALSGTQLNATSPVNGTFSYHPKSGTVPATGPQNLSVTLTPSDGADYSTAADSVQLLVKSAVKDSLSPGSLSFGKQVVNTTSAAKTVTVTNTGKATLNISALTASANFAISATTCGATLAAGKNCTVNVTFTPTQTGSLLGALRFDDNVPASPQTVSLSGAGVPH